MTKYINTKISEELCKWLMKCSKENKYESGTVKIDIPIDKIDDKRIHLARSYEILVNIDTDVNYTITTQYTGVTTRSRQTTIMMDYEIYNSELFDKFYPILSFLTPYNGKMYLNLESIPTKLSVTVRFLTNEERDEMFNKLKSSGFRHDIHFYENGIVRYDKTNRLDKF